MTISRLSHDAVSCLILCVCVFVCDSLAVIVCLALMTIFAFLFYCCHTQQHSCVCIIFVCAYTLCIHYNVCVHFICVSSVSSLLAAAVVGHSSKFTISVVLICHAGIPAILNICKVR